MILPLEKQVVSLELAKRLKELGAPQESWYMWEGIAHDVNESGIILFKYGLKKARDNGNPLRYAAYTVAELGELLPYAVKKEGELYFIHQTPCVGGHNYDSERFCFEFTYTSIKGEAITLPIQEKTEADARAKILIHLLENKLITF